MASHKFYGGKSKPFAPRGMVTTQIEMLNAAIRASASKVCMNYELIPMMDLLDIMYDARQKDLWLQNYAMFGIKWALNNPRYSYWQPMQLNVKAAEGTAMRRILMLINPHEAPFLPSMTGIEGEYQLFMPLKDQEKFYYHSQRQKDLLAQYGRHTVRCAREYEVASKANEALHRLFYAAPCARAFKLFFPEIIPYMVNNPTEYWRKTKNDSWAGKFKLEPHARERMITAVGPHWEQLKAHILGMLMRSKLLETEAREWPLPVYDPDLPIEDWMVRLQFTP